MALEDEILQFAEFLSIVESDTHEIVNEKDRNGVLWIVKEENGLSYIDHYRYAGSSNIQDKVEGIFNGPEHLKEQLLDNDNYPAINSQRRAEIAFNEFIKSLYRRSIHRNESYEKVSKQFLDRISTSEYEFKIISLVINPDLKYEPGEVIDGLQIRKLDTEEIEIIYDQSSSMGSTLQYELNDLVNRDQIYALIKTVTVDISDISKGNHVNDEIMDSVEDFRQVSLDLNISIKLNGFDKVKTSNIVTINSTLRNLSLLTRDSSYQARGIEIAEGEINKESWAEIEKLFDLLRKSPDGDEEDINIALRRMFRSHQRLEIEDIFLDLFIALEAVMSTGTSDNLNDYAKRISIFYGDYSLYEEVMDFGKKRNSIAHGGTEKIEEEEISRLFEIIRNLLIVDLKMRNSDSNENKLVEDIIQKEIDYSHEEIKNLIEWVGGNSNKYNLSDMDRKN